MGKIDLNGMTAEERAALLSDLQAAEAAEKEQREQDIAAYKSLVSDTVEDAFPKLEAISTELAERKGRVRGMFATVIRMKSDLYGVKDGQRSHQFMNAEGTQRITRSTTTTTRWTRESRRLRSISTALPATSKVRCSSTPCSNCCRRTEKEP